MLRFLLLSTPSWHVSLSAVELRDTRDNDHPSPKVAECFVVTNDTIDDHCQVAQRTTSDGFHQFNLQFRWRALVGMLCLFVGN
jgi:hypothetical protein